MSLWTQFTTWLRSLFHHEVAPAAVPSVPITPTQTRASDPVTIPNTNQQVSGVTDAFLRSGAGYGHDGLGSDVQHAAVDYRAVTELVGYGHPAIVTGSGSIKFTMPGPCQIVGGYTAQMAGKTAPNSVKAWISASPESAPPADAQSFLNAYVSLKSATGSGYVNFTSDTGGDFSLNANPA